MASSKPKGSGYERHVPDVFWRPTRRHAPPQTKIIRGGDSQVPVHHPGGAGAEHIKRLTAAAIQECRMLQTGRTVQDDIPPLLMIDPKPPGRVSVSGNPFLGRIFDAAQRDRIDRGQAGRRPGQPGL